MRARRALSLSLVAALGSIGGIGWIATHLPARADDPPARPLDPATPPAPATGKADGAPVARPLRVVFGIPKRPTDADPSASPALDVAVSAGITAVCRSDGSVDLRSDVRGGGTESKTSRFVPPVEGQRFLRVLASEAGEFLALTSRGRVLLLRRDGSKPIEFAGPTQSGARFARDVSTGRAYLGLEIGALLEAMGTTRQIVEVLPSGDMPVTALAAGAGRVAVARADGSYEEVDEATLVRTPAQTVDHGLRAAACSKRWTVVGDDQAQLRWYRRPEGKAPLRPEVVTKLEGPARALVNVPRAHPEEDPEEQHARFAVLVGSSTILLLEGPTFEPIAKADLEGVDVRALVVLEGPTLRLATDGPGGELDLPIESAR